MLIIILLFLFVVFLVWAICNKLNDLFPGLMMLLSGVLLVISLAIWPANYYSTKSEIQQFQSVKQTISTARANGRNIENVAFQLKVAEMNQWLAGKRYWSKSWLVGYMFPDEVEKLEPIQ